MIAIGCDHGGFLLKTAVVNYLENEKIPFKDFGCYNEESCDYPIFAKAVAGSILTGECEKGILICSTGIGISIAANRHEGIRAALCSDSFSAKATREHNNANVLVMGAQVVGVGLGLQILKTFLETDFSNEERHIRRINLIEKN